eukprot:6151047-Karenia_brevis.AAC.1
MHCEQHYAFICRRFHGVATAIHLNNQTGGMKCRTTEMSMGFVKLHAEIIKHNRSAGFGFLADLKSAFYSVTKESVAPVRNGSRSIDDLLRKVPHALAPAIEQLIANDPYVCTVCGNEVLTEAIAQAQTATWLT